MGLVDYATYFGSGPTHMGVGPPPGSGHTVKYQPNVRDSLSCPYVAHFNLFMSGKKYQNLMVPRPLA